MVELIEASRMAIDALTDVLSRANVEAVLKLWAGRRRGKAAGLEEGNGALVWPTALGACDRRSRKPSTVSSNWGSSQGLYVELL